MKSVRLGIGAVICVMLGACSGLLAGLTQEEGCYSVYALNTKQRVELNVGNGNPILLTGGEKIVCTCYQDSFLAGASEDGRIEGAGEDGHIQGVGEDGRIQGVGEDGRIQGAGEDGRIQGAGEDGRIQGAGEEGHVAGASEEGRVAGASEESNVAGVGENSRVGGASESGRLEGAGERGFLSGGSVKLSCRIVPECSGFQLIGYEPDQILVLTSTGKKSVPASCITW